MKLLEGQPQIHESKIELGHSAQSQQHLPCEGTKRVKGTLEDHPNPILSISRPPLTEGEEGGNLLMLQRDWIYLGAEGAFKKRPTTPEDSFRY